MNQALLESLSAISAEEKALLLGAPLNKELYHESGGGFQISSEKLLAKGQLITLRPHTRFVPFPAHGHDFVEIMYVCSGSITHTLLGGESLTLGAGELLFFKLSTTHAIQKATAEDVAVNFIVLTPFFDNVFGTHDSENLLWNFLVAESTTQTLPYIHFDVGDDRSVQNLVENLIFLLQNPGENAQRMAQQTMRLLFMHLLCSPQRILVPAPGRQQSAVVLAALREIDENYTTALLGEVAKRLKVSQGYLSACIKRETGKNFKQLLVERRLSVAAALLKNTALPAEAIIPKVGYANTSHFYREFKKEFGMSPKVYRRQ